jgi:hypothetical protein
MKPANVLHTCVFFACLLGGSRLADAASILFSNLVQPGNQYGPDGVGIGHTPGSLNVSDYVLYAVPFVPSTTAAVTSIQVPLGVISGPDQLLAYLMSDAGGVPGAAIATFPLSSLPGPPSPLLDIPVGPGVVVTGGQRYWLAATGGPLTFGTWTLNLFQGDPTDGGAISGISNGVSQPWVVGTGSRTGALQVIGDPVPEPSTLLLTAVAFAVFRCARRCWV